MRRPIALPPDRSTVIDLDDYPRAEWDAMTQVLTLRHRARPEMDVRYERPEPGVLRLVGLGHKVKELESPK